MPIKTIMIDGVVKHEAMPFLISMSEVPACPTIAELMSYRMPKPLNRAEDRAETVVRNRKAKNGQVGCFKCQSCKETLPKSMFPENTFGGGYRKCWPCRKAQVKK